MVKEIFDLFDIQSSLVDKSQGLAYLSRHYTKGKKIRSNSELCYLDAIIVALLSRVYTMLKIQRNERHCDIPDIDQYSLKVLIRDTMLTYSLLTGGNDLYSKYCHAIYALIVKDYRRTKGFFNINRQALKGLYDGSLSAEETSHFLKETRQFIFDVTKNIVDCDEMYYDFDLIMQNACYE